MLFHSTHCPGTTRPSDKTQRVGMFRGDWTSSTPPKELRRSSVQRCCRPEEPSQSHRENLAACGRNWLSGPFEIVVHRLCRSPAEPARPSKSAVAVDSFLSTVPSLRPSTLMLICPVAGNRSSDGTNTRLPHWHTTSVL